MQSRVDTFCELVASPYTTADEVRDFVNEEKLDYDAKHSIYEHRAIDWAAQSGNVEVLHCLIEYVRVNLDYKNETKNILQYSMDNPDPQVREYLLHPMTAIHKKLNDNTTELHVHAMAGRFSYIEQKLLRHPEALLETTTSGKNLFMWMHFGVKLGKATPEMEEWLENFARVYTKNLQDEKNWEMLAKVYALRSQDEATGVFSLLLLQEAINSYELAIMEDFASGRDPNKNTFALIKLKEEFFTECASFAREKEVNAPWNPEIISQWQDLANTVKETEADKYVTISLAEAKMNYALSLFNMKEELRLVFYPKILKLLDEANILNYVSDNEERKQRYNLKAKHLRLGIGRALCNLTNTYLNDGEDNKALTIAEEFSLPYLKDLIEFYKMENSQIYYLQACTHHGLALLRLNKSKEGYQLCEDHAQQALTYFKKIDLSKVPPFYKSLEDEIHTVIAKAQKHRKRSQTPLLTEPGIKEIVIPEIKKQVSIQPTPGHQEHPIVRVKTPAPKHGLFRSRSMSAIDDLCRKKAATPRLTN